MDAKHIGFGICMGMFLCGGKPCQASSEHREHELFQAASQGQLRRVQDLVRQDVLLTSTDQMGKTALHHAAGNGQKHVVQFLLSAAEEQSVSLINSQDASGRTSLVEAITPSDVGIVRILIRSGTDVNRATNAQYAPLHLAACPEVTELETENVLEDCMRRHLKYFSFAEIVYLLIEAGAEIDLYDMQRETPLYHAILNKLHTVVRFLLYAGADVFAVDRQGASRLANAFYESSKLVVYELLRFGVPIMPDALTELRAQGLDYFVQNNQKQWGAVMKSICNDRHIPQDIGGLITSFVVTQVVATKHETISQQTPPAS